MKVKAIAMGFFNGRRVRPGTIFNITEKMRLPKWVVPVVEAVVDEIVEEAAEKRGRSRKADAAPAADAGDQ